MAHVRFDEDGYIGFSMSIDAAEALENDEKPKEHWTKAAMIKAVENVLEFEGLLTKDNVAVFKSMKKEELFDNCFEWTNWHEMGSYANPIDFYSVDSESVISYVV